jgi:hypothetical protein
MFNIEDEDTNTPCSDEIIETLNKVKKGQTLTKEDQVNVDAAMAIVLVNSVNNHGCEHCLEKKPISTDNVRGAEKISVVGRQLCVEKGGHYQYYAICCCPACGALLQDAT